jgi:hypothetical protein
MATPEKQKEIRDDMLKRMPDLFFEFTADTLVMGAGNDTRKATYKVTKSMGRTVWFDTVSTEGKDGQAAVDKMTGEFLDDGTLKLSRQGDPTPMLWKRAR